MFLRIIRRWQSRAAADAAPDHFLSPPPSAAAAELYVFWAPARKTKIIGKGGRARAGFRLRIRALKF